MKKNIDEALTQFITLRNKAINENIMAYFYELNIDIPTKETGEIRVEARKLPSGFTNEYFYYKDKLFLTVEATSLSYSIKREEVKL